MNTLDFVRFPTISFTCRICNFTGSWLHQLQDHAGHERYEVNCNLCQLTMSTSVLAMNHFRTHQQPLTSTQRSLTPNEIPATPCPSEESNNRLRSLSPVSERSEGNSPLFPLAQPPPPYSSSEDERLVPLLISATEHLVWLAAAMARVPVIRPNMPLSDFVEQAYRRFGESVSNTDTAFRRRLATDYPESLMNAVELPVNDIARILLPLYESWATAARNRHVNL